MQELQRVAKISRVVSLRETGKLRRRQRILEAARSLVVSEGLDGVSMRRIADRAEVSTRTLYNLYSAKDDIFHALMLRNLHELGEKLAELGPNDPLERSRMFIEVSIEQMCSRPDLYRPLLRGLEIRPDRFREPALILRARDLHEEALAEAIACGLLLPRIKERSLAHQILMAHGHALRLWSRGVLDAKGLHAQSLHAWCLCLLAVASESGRPMLEAELERLDSCLQPTIDRLSCLGLAAPCSVVSRGSDRPGSG